MILFVGPVPTARNERDGMVQRVSAIDQVFSGTARVLIEPSLRRHLRLIPRREVRGELTVYWLNSVLHFPLVLLLTVRSQFIYVHSVYMSLLVLPIYLTQKVVTDLHGAVPEELQSMGHKILGLLYQLVERLVIHRSVSCVYVTQAMAEHVKHKYQSSHKYYVIPIFQNTAAAHLDAYERLGSWQKQPYSVVYSGGVQKWQCVDSMLAAVSKAPVFLDFIFLSGSESHLLFLIRRQHLETRVQVKSVPQSEIGEYYLHASMGFMLRESSVINRVACPTKLSEYLSWGVVPIVMAPDIGDFGREGYKYVTLEDFIAGRLPLAGELDQMRTNNYRVVRRLAAKSNSDMQKLQDHYGVQHNKTCEIGLC